MRRFASWILPVLAATAAAQDLRWKLPERGAARYDRNLKVEATVTPKDAWDSRPWPAFAPSPVVLDGELDAKKKRTEEPLCDLRDILPRLCLDLSQTKPAKAKLELRSVNVGVDIDAEWGPLGDDGAQTVQATFQDAEPASIGAARAHRPLVKGTLRGSRVVDRQNGRVQSFEGTIEIDGRPVAIRNPRDARVQGIETAYQDLALCPNLGSAHNLVLGDEPVKVHLGPFSLRDEARGRAVANERLRQLGIALDDDSRPVRLLSGGQRQSVAIARIADDDVKVVILDEPTAALGVKQTRNVLDLVHTLADRGAAVILISHDIDTIFEVADRVVVLRLGAVVHDGPIAELTQLDLVHLMAGLVKRPEAAARTTSGAPTEVPA